MNEMYKNSHFIRVISSVICTAPNIVVPNTCTKEGPVFSGLHLHTDPTDPLLAIYFSSTFQNDGIRTWCTLHERWLNSTKFLMLKERQLLVLWKMSTKRKKWVFSFQWLKISKLLSVQFILVFICAFLCWSDTGYLYLVPEVGWLPIVLIKFIAKERVSWNS